jgi:hypothetical protein
MEATDRWWMSWPKIEEKPIRLQQSWDAGTEAMPSNDAATIEYDRWAYGTNV